MHVQRGMLFAIWFCVVAVCVSAVLTSVVAGINESLQVIEFPDRRRMTFLDRLVLAICLAIGWSMVALLIFFAWAAELHSVLRLLKRARGQYSVTAKMSLYVAVVTFTTIPLFIAAQMVFDSIQAFGWFMIPMGLAYSFSGRRAIHGRSRTS